MMPIEEWVSRLIGWPLVTSQRERWQEKQQAPPGDPGMVQKHTALLAPRITLVSCSYIFTITEVWNAEQHKGVNSNTKTTFVPLAVFCLSLWVDEWGYRNILLCSEQITVWLQIRVLTSGAESWPHLKSHKGFYSLMLPGLAGAGHRLRGLYKV